MSNDLCSKKIIMLTRPHGQACGMIELVRKLGLPAYNCHMWNGPLGKGFFRTFDHSGTVRSYVRPVSAAFDRWPR